MAGGQIDIRVEPDVKEFPSKLESGLGGALGTATKIGSALGIALGAGAMAKSVMTLGRDFESQMNTMTAVSQGTEAQMEAVANRARELGNDTDLTATSAYDAAAAMTELAKGGFSVEDSMGAAKGTLQLAAAAQIEAADAATIQSQALQSFSLGAEDAARVSDILAGAANASSAEIEGIAQGLQQSGTVANQFGISIDDTATALAMFANAGIQGSDAGTMLKSALLALTDQGKPAQAAIEELGLSIYNAKGEFVGLPELFDQLQTAQQNMTPEAYQAATAVLFGSDAMRLSGIAAEQGADGFNSLKEDVTRAGQAAEVAAAQTQGLPGALERAQNAAEELGMKVYDSIKGPVVDAANAGVDAMEQLGPTIETAADLGASALSGLLAVATPVAGVALDIVGAIGQLPTPLLAMGAAIPLAKMTGLTGMMSSGAGTVKLFGSNVRDTGRAVGDIKRFFDGTGRSISTFDAAIMAAGTSNNSTMRSMGQAYTNTGTQLRATARETKATAQATTGLSRVFTSAKGSVQAFGGTAAGVAGGGLSLLKAGAGGLVSALGGVPGLIMGGVGLALGHLAQKHQEAAAAEAEHKAHQDALRESLDQTTGSITEQSRKLQEDKLRDDGVMEAATDLGLSTDTVVDASFGDSAAQQRAFGAIHDSTTALVEGSSYWEKYGDQMVAAGVSADDFADSMNGSASATQKLNDAFDSDDKLHTAGRAWGNVSGKLEEANEATEKLSQTLGQAGRDADDMFSENAEERMIAYKENVENTSRALDLLKGSDMQLEGISEGKVTVSVEADAITDETRQKLEDMKATVGEEMNGRVSITFNEDSDILGILDAIGLKLSTMPGGYIAIDNYETEEAKAALDQLGITADMLVEHNGQMTLDLNDQELQARLIDLGLAANIDGTFTLSDNFAQILAGNANIDGTQLNGNYHVSDNIDNVNRRKNGLRTPTSSTHTISIVTQGGAAGYNQLQDAGYSDMESWLIMDGYYKGGRVPRNAQGSRLPAAAAGTPHAGYRLPTTGPGTDVTDGILGISRAGVPLSWLDGGEWVVNKKSSQRYHPVFHALNNDDPETARRALDSLPGHASGGVVESITGLVNANFPEMTITDTYRNAADLHGQGKAVDVSNGYDSTPEMRNMAQWFFDRYQYQLAELIHSPFAHNVDEGKDVGDGVAFFGAGTMDGHRNHVHIAAHAPLSSVDEAYTDRTKEEDKEKTPEEKSRDEAAKSAADEAERRRKMVAESKPEVVQTNAQIGPDPLAQAMFNPSNDPDGLLSLTRAADYTPRFGNRYRLDESDALVEFLLWAKGGQDEADSELAAAFTVDNDPRGIRALTEAGVFTSRFGDAFAVGERSGLVKAILAAREKGGIQTLRVSQWNEEYGDTDTSISGIAGKVAKSLVESTVSDVFAAFGVDDDLGPLAQAGIATAKTAYGIKTGSTYEDMQSAARDSSRSSGNKFSDAYQDMTSDSTGTSGQIIGDSSSVAVAAYNPGAGAGQWRSAILNALSRTGRPSSEAGITEQQVDIESGGDPKAVNNWDSNAAAGNPSGGLLQVIETTRQAMRDMFPAHHAGLKDDLFDPLENLVSGIDWSIYKYDGPSNIWPTAAGYALGGSFQMMSSGTAAIVPPNTPRVIGDNPSVDEFYLPDNDASIPTAEVWARRRGLALTKARNEEKRMVRAYATAQQSSSSGPTFNSNVNVNGFDRREVTAGIRDADRIARWKEGY